jgi:hypothetical protein
VLIVVSEPVDVHCTAWVVPVFCPLTVTCAEPATSVPGPGLKSGGLEEHPATASNAAAATADRVLTVQNLRRDWAFLYR